MLFDLIRETSDVRAIVVINPGNPTGQVNQGEVSQVVLVIKTSFAVFLFFFCFYFFDEINNVEIKKNCSLTRQHAK